MTPEETAIYKQGQAINALKHYHKQHGQEVDGRIARHDAEIKKLRQRDFLLAWTLTLFAALFLASALIRLYNH